MAVSVRSTAFDVFICMGTLQTGFAGLSEKIDCGFAETNEKLDNITDYLKTLISDVSDLKADVAERLDNEESEEQK